MQIINNRTDFTCLLKLHNKAEKAQSLFLKRQADLFADLPEKRANLNTHANGNRDLGAKKRQLIIWQRKTRATHKHGRVTKPLKHAGAM